jgi:hypothetical protein
MAASTYLHPHRSNNHTGAKNLVPSDMPQNGATIGRSAGSECVANFRAFGPSVANRVIVPPDMLRTGGDGHWIHKEKPMRNFAAVMLSVSFLFAVLPAEASNFRVADQVYLPIAGRVSVFRTDVFISNLSSDPVIVKMVLASGESGTLTPNLPVISLKGFERREMVDFFQSVLGISNGAGQVVFSACRAAADCSSADANGENPNYRDISVESRIYAVDGDGKTNGQLFNGYPWYSYVSMLAAPSGLDRVFVTGLRNTGAAGQVGTFRTNIGVTNSSQFSSTTLTLHLFDRNGAALGDHQITLGPLGQIQQEVSDLFPAFTRSPDSTGAWMTVEQTSVAPTDDAKNQPGCEDGCPGFFAYGSLLDNATNDPTTLEAQYFAHLTSDALKAIYKNGNTVSPARRAVRH